MYTTEREVTIEPGGNVLLKIHYSYTAPLKGRRDGGWGPLIEPDEQAQIHIEHAEIIRPGGRIEPMRRQMFDVFSEAGTWDKLEGEILADREALREDILEREGGR